MRQCVIYDSDKPDARLIGIEYIVAEEVRHAERLAPSILTGCPNGRV